MKIAVIGVGNVGSVLGKAWAAKGHEVLYGARDPKSQKAQAAVKNSGANARADTAKNAAESAEVIVLAVPFGEAEKVVRELGSLKGKVLLDVTNPLTADFSGLSVGHTDSAGEKVARAAKDARVVKVFNSTGAGNMANPIYKGSPLTMAYAGDDAEAKKVVAKLVADVGFEPLDAGPLKNARLLEPLAMLWIYLVYGAGLGPDVAFTLVKR